MTQRGMVLVLFRSRLTPEAGDDDHTMADGTKAWRERWYRNYELEIAEIMRRARPGRR